MRSPQSDILTITDKLKREQMLQDVVDDVRGSVMPRVIGIHGDWGSGKSSFLWQLEFALSGKTTRDCDDQIREDGKKLLKSGSVELPVVWFEAWKHQNDEAPVLALLYAMRSGLSMWHQALGETKKITSVAAEGALSAIDRVTSLIGLKVDPKGIREIGDRYEKERHLTPPAQVSIQRLMEEAVDQLLGNHLLTGRSEKRRRRLVILIDDLDRCEPENARALLEGLRVFLSLRNCVFVIAMDETIIEEAFMKEKSSEKTELREQRRRARLYIEKIVQAVYRMPFILDPVAYLFDLLKVTEEDDFAKGIKECMTNRNAVPPNPRKIKMLANVLERMRERIRPTVAAGLAPKQAYATAYLLSYIYQFEPRLYRLIAHHEEFLNQQVVFPCKEKKADSHLGDHVVIGVQTGGLPMYSDPILSAHFWPWELCELIDVVPKDARKALLI